MTGSSELVNLAGPVLAVVFGFFASQILIGVLLRKKAGVWEQYAVAGRAFGPIIITFAIVGTWWPGVIFTGFVGLPLFLGGIGMYCALYSTFTLLFGYLMWGRAWKLSKEQGLKTIGGFMGYRYNSKVIQFIFGVFGNTMHFPWMIIELITAGIAIHFASFGLIPMWLAMIIGLIVIYGFTVTAGWLGVMITHLVQGMLLTFGGITLFFVIANFFWGGYGPGFQELYSLDPLLVTTEAGAAVFGSNYFSSIVLASMIGGWCWPAMYGKVFAANSVRSLKQSILAAPALVLVFASLLFMLAMLGHMIPEALEKPDVGLFVMAQMAAGPYGVTLIAICAIAGCLSTFGACIVTNAVMVSEDLVKMIKPTISDVKLTFIARITVVVQGLIAYGIALAPLPLILFYAIAAYQGIIQYFPALMFGLFWRKVNKYAAIGGCIVGQGIAMPLTLLPQFLSGGVAGGVTVLGGWTGGILGISINIIILVVGSLIKRPSKIDHDRANAVFDLFKSEKYRE